MPKASSHKPAGSSTVSPYLCVKGAAKAIEFYKQAFGAEERFRMDNEGKVGHAEIAIGESVIMMADEYPELEFRAPASVGGSPVQLLVYVADVDATVKKAEALGARTLRPVKDQFYGDRSGMIEDPFGHRWHVSTHVEDVAPDELRRRMSAKMAPG